MPAAVDPFFLEILVCPETRQRLARARGAGRLNAAIEKGAVTVKSGERMTEKVDALIVRQERAR